MRLALALLLPFAIANAPTVSAQELGGEARLFTIPVTRDARAIMQNALEHLQARRYPEAVASLQRLIESHEGDVLPARMDDSTGRPSFQPFHTGAASWATTELTRLPTAALQYYRTRYEKPAQTALVSARRSGDRRALIEVGLRWPLTDAAERAWWTLGDLEMEIGNTADASRAWNRAGEIASLFDNPLTEGGRRRVELAQRLQLEAAEPSAHTGVPELRLPGPGEGGGPVPEDFADAWTQPIPRSPYSDHQSLHNIFPVLDGDRVFVSNGWQVQSLDAYTGSVLWQSQEMPGWTASNRLEFSKGIDHPSALIAPAVSGSVVVATLQVPYSRLNYTDYQGIRITVPIPERRLFAFDRETGKTLWHHSPSPLWDGETGSFSERMILAGPPVISGSRVLVPCYLMQGRVDFHVACYDLTSGTRLWSTQLISGQRALNMFGRHEKEFCAPPVRIEGDRAVVLTQLGTVVSLDIYTGRIHWQARYEQIPLPRTRGWRTQERVRKWRNSPPVVADGVVIATPVDSLYFFGIDLEEGTVLWQYANESLKSPSITTEVDTLLGADENVLYFGGERIAAYHAPAGLARSFTGGRFTHQWVFPVEGYDAQRSPRATLARDHVVVSTRRGRVVIDKATGFERRRTSLPWIRERQGRIAVGNLLVGSGMLFTANASEVSGLFDWSILEERALARIEADPADVSALLTLAQVREQHGTLLYQNGDVRAALDRLREAQRLLEPRLEDPEHREVVAERLHRVLRTAARAREGLADIAGALDLLDRALPLAPTSDDTRDTLLEREAILRDRDREAWLATLIELERRCYSREMPGEWWAGAVGPDDSLADAFIDADLLDDDLPVGLWVLLARARAHGRWGNVEAGLHDLHESLRRYGDRRLAPGRTVFDLASARIALSIEQNGLRAYASFEARARKMLDEALATDSIRDLEAVRRRFPHSTAARQAGDHLLDLAFAEGDAERVARLVRESLSRDTELSPQDAKRIVLLGEILGREGNLEFQRGVLRAVAEVHPDLVVSVAGRNVRVAEHLADLPTAAAPTLPADVASFDGNLTVAAKVDHLEGSFFEVGYLPAPPAEAEAPPNQRLVLLREIRNRVILEIHDSTDPVRPVVEETLPRSMQDPSDFELALAPERVVIADGEDVVVLDAATGSEAWPMWSAPRGFEIAELGVHGGVLVLQLVSDEGDYEAVALDVQAGLELWHKFLPRGPSWRAPVFSDTRAVFLTQTQSWQLPARAHVVDLFRGVTLGEIDLAGPLPGDAYDSVFAEGDILVVPSFRMATTPDRNFIAGYDLARFGEAWRYEFSGGRELEALFRVAHDTYMVVAPGDDGTGGAILQLQTRLGATRLVKDLTLEDRVLGTTRHRSARPGPTQLDAPFLFYYTKRPGENTTRITAVHLPYGKRWSSTLRVPTDELYDARIAQPAVSSDMVAVTYSVRGANRLASETSLTLIDRESGMKRGGWVLNDELGKADDLRLIGLGDALFFLSRTSHHGFPLEIWENRK